MLKKILRDRIGSIVRLPVDILPHDAVRRIVEKRESGLAKSALTLANQAKSRWPENMAVCLEYAKSLQQSDGSKAAKAWADCIDKFPNDVKPSWFQNQIDSIRSHHEGLPRFRQVEMAHPDIQKCLEKMREHRVESTGKHGRLIPKKQTRKMDEIDLRETASLLTQSNKLDDAKVAWARYFELHASRAPLSAYRAYFKVHYRRASSREEVEEILKILDFFETEISKRWPVDLASYGDARSENVSANRAYLAAARWNLKFGRAKRASHWIECIPRISSLQEQVEEIELVLNSSDMFLMFQEVDGSELGDWSSSIFSWRNPRGSKNVVFVFCGLGGQFAFHVSVLHQILRQFDCHVVYLRDEEQCFFAHAAEWENTSDLVTQLRQISEELGAQRVFTIGHSAGGNAAIRFGADLDAVAVLAFSPVIAPLKRGASIAAQLKNTLDNLSLDFETNVATYLQGRQELPRIVICFGELCELDRIDAERMSTFSCVRYEIASAYTQHNSLRWFMANGKLPTLLNELLVGP